MVFTHALVGSLTTKKLIKNKKLTSSQITTLYTVGIVSSVLPDFDTIVLLFDSSLLHRQFISHSFIPYLIIILFAYLFAFLTKNRFLKYLISAFAIGTLGHLVLDYLYGGIAAFSPIKRGMYGFSMSFPSTTRIEWAQGYLVSKFMLGEIIVFGLFLTEISKIKNKVAKILPIIFIAISSLMLSLVTFI